MKQVRGTVGGDKRMQNQSAVQLGDKRMRNQSAVKMGKSGDKRMLHQSAKAELAGAAWTTALFLVSLQKLQAMQ